MRLASRMTNVPATSARGTFSAISVKTLSAKTVQHTLHAKTANVTHQEMPPIMVTSVNASILRFVQMESCRNYATPVMETVLAV